jgi:hypothetical protein
MNQGNKILLILCIIALIAGVAVIFEASAFQKKAKITTGIVDNSRISSYHVIYKSDDGVEHNLYISAKNHRRHDRDQIKVFYRIDNPDKARISDGIKGGRKIIIVAIVLLLFDLYLIYTNKKRKKAADNFKSTGRKVQAEITSIEVDLNTTIQNKHPYLINCKWVDPISGRNYTHTIRQIWIDPAPVLAGRNYLDVYIDRENPDKYFMDTEFLGVVAV